MKIKIGIVEDQKNILENLVRRFRFYEEIDIVMQASNGEEALEKLEKLPDGGQPQILLMDIGLPGMSGIDTTAHVKSAYPDIDIMIQTVFEDNDRIFQSIQAGASGYLLKDDSIEKYVDAIRELKNGGAPISANVAAKILTRVRADSDNNEKAKDHLMQKFSITDRELDILNGIIEDLTEHEIADKLFISPHTVRTHIKNIYKKLHVHSRASAVKIALQNGLMS